MFRLIGNIFRLSKLRDEEKCTADFPGRIQSDLDCSVPRPGCESAVFLERSFEVSPQKTDESQEEAAPLLMTLIMLP